LCSAIYHLSCGPQGAASAAAASSSLSLHSRDVQESSFGSPGTQIQGAQGLQAETSVKA
jgi:hypothetical protein